MQNKREHSNEDFIFGIRAVIEAIRAGKDVDKVLIKRGLSGDLIKELYTEMQTHQVPYQIVPDEKLNRVSQKNHQGVIALVSPISFSVFEEEVARLFEAAKEPFILALDEITDVRNFGAIVRSAECAGVDVIVIPEKGSARIGSDAVKTSAGALYKLPVCRVTSLKKALQYAQQSGIKVFGATEKTSEVYYRQNLTGPICLVMGSEDIGLSVEVIRTCDHLIKIPILGQIESLNVSAAASVLLYEVVRQRQGV
ncbi:MAG TPA: 23S rRNA (guanosine(2251)-2'-O)-methyltransferase RlmB [Marinilabiliales bacterium]|jgi:23S rRNA (guanosine2251-2'-O)-methyltransferase|nr:MAG: 23S rRNA (guanosine(2251)-2'-O)-methyltransferase RlmB [Bacteroidetes bacterium GWA2_40_14]OFX59618.1 MAG: 23S rRNA (guanosine(2251)-2'-O)-methyltransferase RlmB [Bacteroidetes bacterium GWC2_40_13]OFX73916.1 MAG: 23S rRNA (guanosine(2251)-2'-O)-methyltransferase RlmB [Bacteroidetes bacterium GWD2_40_43]OFX93250.1 MAG: 23S rRNA (guanosine(2251)-2'-O)-methyltransferase RlmB [Bacteroidetes bacterium GWE2_40_63]OFY17688.1 MAG: 23S rRNA (guanosine(2251)-2'-O)-methyltransferase RlmB [Bactero